MDADIARYLDALITAAQRVPGLDPTGAYAAGSVALDAYQPGRSDVDVALTCAAPLPDDTKHALVAALRHESLPCPARGLELVVYTRDAARSGTPAPGFEVELNTGARMDFRATYRPDERPAADGLFWYALDRSILHQSGLTLRGEPAADAFGEIGDDALRALLAEALTWWLAAAPGAEDAVLGACRSLARVRHGVWLDKISAGRRIIADADADPDTDLITRCIAARTGGEPPDGRDARAFQQRVLDEIR
ncbi:nucleotidyltransferase domain-containing protein [Catenuloplanes japonicus]|uniref:nucleotidyltransferase domain-containing protein n=1 Tax=Catenuloplanes japonicus TaxID=33876 RepID=UPI000B288727|nr:nucleotidyltransferase domain-containing protein [Catenuloplanes japonicus]